MTKTIPLSTPIERRSKDSGKVLDAITELTLQPLKTGDLLAAIDHAGGEERAGKITGYLIARSARLKVQEVNDLPIEDGMKLLDAVKDFLPASLRTGGIASLSSEEALDIPPTADDGDQES
jgi:hypothetical protein